MVRSLNTLLPLEGVVVGTRYLRLELRETELRGFAKEEETLVRSLFGDAKECLTLLPEVIGRLTFPFRKIAAFSAAGSSAIGCLSPPGRAETSGVLCGGRGGREKEEEEGRGRGMVAHGGSRSGRGELVMHGRWTSLEEKGRRIIHILDTCTHSIHCISG